MHADRLRQPLRRLREALAPPDGGGASDGQLLERFLADRDEAAFAALVRRHGPMVLGAVRRVLRHAQDAEDCFQAAFLVLAQRAGSVRKRGSLASWLYGVAYRVALDARAAAARRHSRERQVGQMPQPEVAPSEPQDWRPLLDEELMALPEKYRAAVVLCDLEGKARKEVARLLHLSEGTLSSRLARARALLAGRLSRRGVALSAGALAVTLAGGAATAALPEQLAEGTAKVAALVAAGNLAAATAPAALLMRGAQRGMLMTKLKVCAALAAVAAVLGAGGLAYRAVGQTTTGPAKGATPITRPAKNAVRSLSELELLRKEVDILKLQVEVLQDKVRALGARPGAPGQATGVRGQGLGGGGFPGGGGFGGGGLGGFGGFGGGFPGGGAAKPGQERGVRRGAAEKAPDAVKQAEDALKALREARDPEARRRAAEALEKAARQLRGQPGPAPGPAS